MGQLDIQSQPYEGLNSKCLARIYANKQYTTSGGSGSRKRTHTNTKASKNYATKPPDEEPLTNILGSSGPTHPPALRAAKAALRARGGAPWGGAAPRSKKIREKWNIFIASDSPAAKVPGARASRYRVYGVIGLHIGNYPNYQLQLWSAHDPPNPLKARFAQIYLPTYYK